MQRQLILCPISQCRTGSDKIVTTIYQNHNFQDFNTTLKMKKKTYYRNYIDLNAQYLIAWIV